MRRSVLMVMAIILTGVVPAISQAIYEDERYVLETDPMVLKKLEQWQDLKFGLLMHWGAYSQWGIVESWSICAEDEGWCRRPYEDYEAYKKEYESLKRTFNPVDFDPDRWAVAAKDAGMKYVVFTTKHHDGFCMFDSKYTDYKVTSEECPFHVNDRANIAKEVFDAFRAKGLWAGAYFSKPDWNNDDYWWPNFATPDRNVNYDPAAYPEKWESFVQFTHNQIMELMTDYGDIDILWLDGGWVAKKSPETIRRAYEHKLKNNETGFIKAQVINQDIRMDELVEKAREKQPGLIVVDRAVHGKNQNYLTPENRIPEKPLPYPWESCIISGGGWSYTPDAKYMSGQEAIHMLIDIVIKGGNLLLNVAPGPNGDWQQGAYNLLGKIGAWMDVNSEAIYGTRTLAPYKENNIGMTQKEDQAYFIYMDESGSGKMPEKIRIESHQPVAGAEVTLLGFDEPLNWKSSSEGFVANIPSEIRNNPPSEYAWVVKVSKIKE
ncbi:alpha-L-fucosidase [Anaerophaga thermohalophila]|uniref:alpha-L-fucosidase n=1 Tax=Anaerophaga thermohalophila TaxID=177400 RepID=UPI000311962F|nr:alpha-L-fucosidase [Anaerophaga thermohalophila]